MLAGAGRSKPTYWLAFASRLLLFALVVGFAARAYGPTAALLVLIAAVLTRGLIVRKRLASP